MPSFLLGSYTFPRFILNYVCGKENVLGKCFVLELCNTNYLYLLNLKSFILVNDIHHPF